MSDTLKEIILKQLALLQDVCKMEMLPEEAAQISEALSAALRVGCSVHGGQLVELKLDQKALARAVLGD